jgi:hypothetical protein
MKPRHLRRAIAPLLVWLVSLSADAQPGSGDAAPPPVTPPAAAAAPTPGAVKPFSDIIKDAKVIPGLFPLYQKDDKVWLAIAPEQLDQPFLFSYNIPNSVGERGLYGSQMGRAYLAVLRRIGNQIQLVAKNTEFFAPADTPEARFVGQSFSDSLLASAAVVSGADAKTKAVLIEANSLLFTDIPGYLTRLETAFRMPFALDARNSSIVRLHNNPGMTGIHIQAHFSVPKLAAPPLASPTPPAPATPPPKTTPDPRSLFVGFYFSFVPLPKSTMVARRADERIGHFVTTRSDYGTDATPKLKVHYVNRWRLEKHDPSAVLSAPKTPITYWLDRNVPEKYRQAVTAGILEWNKAFERIGFQDAIVVRQQTDQDDFDTMDARHASLRWFTGADVGFAIGPSQVDPRSGEILDADIGMSDVFARGARRLIAEDVGKPHRFDSQWAAAMAGSQDQFLACHYAAEKGDEVTFANDLLEARGLDMAGPEAEALAQAYVKEVVMHEVGHTLGLRHNFRASTVYPSGQLRIADFTRANGLAGSVMDYLPFNLAREGEAQGEYVMSTLGPYDYLAIEYAYRPLAPEEETAELERIAGRTASDPLLGYATDEDAGYGSAAIGIDPEVNRFDLGADPIEYYRKRLQLTRELWSRLERLQLAPGESYERLTRSFASGFAQLARVAPLVAKYVGGVRHLRDRAGSGRPLYEPTSAARQQAALALVTDSLFRPESFRLSPSLVSRLAVDHFERGVNPDISIANSVLNLQKGVLDILLADQVAQRLLDARDKVADTGALLPLAALYDGLQGAIWSELKGNGEIPPLRRNLQREHLKRLATTLLRSGTTAPADARALQRENAKQLRKAIESALARQKDKTTRAHLAESLDTLNEALKAPLQRTGL